MSNKNNNFKSYIINKLHLTKLESKIEVVIVSRHLFIGIVKNIHINNG